jgi:ribosome-binding factor A
VAVNRIARIEEEVKRALSAIIRTEVKDDRLSQMVSVTRVDITSDLKYAKVYISVYDTDKKRAASIQALNHGASFVRTKLSKAVDIRRVPELTFILDDSIEYGLKISKILNEVNRKN